MDMSKMLKKISLCLALGLIAFVLIVASLFLGNPISYLLAFMNASNLIRTEYAESDYKIESIGFEMMHGEYVVSIKSPTKVDEYFQLWMDGFGKIRTNNYDLRVEGRANVQGRLSNEYGELVKTGLWDKIDFEKGRYSIMYFSREGMREDSLRLEDLELNKAYDIAGMARLQGYLGVSAEAEWADYEYVAQCLLELKRVADENNVPFYAVDFSLRVGHYSQEIKLSGFLYEDIYEEGLVERIQQADEDPL